MFEIAAKYGQVEIIKELTKHYPAGLNSQSHTGRTPLSVAMWQWNPKVLQALLDGGADVNLPDFDGRPPVSFGISRAQSSPSNECDLEMVRMLVEKYGANINHRDKEDRAPLSYVRKEEGVLRAKLVKLGTHD